MHLLKRGPVAALVLSGVALGLLVVAPLGPRLGWWQYAFGLYRLMPASGLIAAAAVALSILTFARALSQLRWRGLAMLSVALVLGAALVYVPVQFFYTRRMLPPILDNTTATDNPPAFSAVLAARAAEHA